VNEIADLLQRQDLDELLTATVASVNVNACSRLMKIRYDYCLGSPPTPYIILWNFRTDYVIGWACALRLELFERGLPFFVDLMYNPETSLIVHRIRAQALSQDGVDQSHFESSIKMAMCGSYQSSVAMQLGYEDQKIVAAIRRVL
jgi:hypothetical protein